MNMSMGYWYYFLKVDITVDLEKSGSDALSPSTKAMGLGMSNWETHTLLWKSKRGLNRLGESELLR